MSEKNNNVFIFDHPLIQHKIALMRDKHTPTKEFRELAADVIATRVKDMELNLFNMRFQASMGKLENTALLNVTRKDIARAKTILKQKSATGK